MSSNYDCRHFTKSWCVPLKNLFSEKGKSGEDFLYNVLCEVAGILRTNPPELLGEPDPVYEDVRAEILGRTNEYPDCYLKVDDLETLWEAKNIFYYHGDWHRKNTSYKTPFFYQQEQWVRRYVTSKHWDERAYPIRNSARDVWSKERGQAVKQYQWVYPNIEKTRKVYVATVQSYNGFAQTLLDKFFGNAQIFANHAMFTPEFLEKINASTSPVEVDCAIETQGLLRKQVMDLVYGMLPKR